MKSGEEKRQDVLEAAHVTLIPTFALITVPFEHESVFPVLVNTVQLLKNEKLLIKEVRFEYERL